MLPTLRTRSARRYDQRGVALPSVVTVLSIVAVAAAAIAFFATVGGSDHPAHLTAARSPQASAVAAVKPRPSSSPDASPDTSPATSPDTQPSSAATKPHPAHHSSQASKPRRKRPKLTPVDRAAVPVVVFNDTPIAGLAGSVGSRVSALGWRFVAADNWSGPVPSTTVYYPRRLKAAAQQLARDLHIGRLRPAQVPAMSADRVTVILTGPLR